VEITHFFFYSLVISLKTKAFWDIAPYSLVGVDWPFKVRTAFTIRVINKPHAKDLPFCHWLASSPDRCPLPTGVPKFLLVRQISLHPAKLWRFLFITLMMQAVAYTPLKRQCTPTRLHGSIFHNTLIFILAAVRTWYLTYYFFVLIK
jgi:hypothetical protein